MLLKKFLMALAIALYSVVPVFAGDSDRARGHGQGHGAKMLNLKAGEVGLISRYKREYQIAIGRSLTPDQRPLVGVPSHQFRRGQSKGTGLHWGKGSGKGWGKGYGKNSNKRYGMGTDKGGKRGDKGDKRGDKGAGMRWNKGEGKDWGKDYGKNSNKRYGMGGDKGAGKREDQSRGDKWQKNREVNIDTRGEFGGLGLEVTMENGTIRVVAPIDGTPAHQAGLLPGDRIIRLEDTLVQGMSLDEAVRQMRGEPGTQIRLLIVREGQTEPFEITLKRAIIRIDRKKKSFDSD